MVLKDHTKWASVASDNKKSMQMPTRSSSEDIPPSVSSGDASIAEDATLKKFKARYALSSKGAALVNQEEIRTQAVW